MSIAFRMKLAMSPDEGSEPALNSSLLNFNLNQIQLETIPVNHFAFCLQAKIREFNYNNSA